MGYVGSSAISLLRATVRDSWRCRSLILSLPPHPPLLSGTFPNPMVPGPVSRRHMDSQSTNCPSSPGDLGSPPSLNTAPGGCWYKSPRAPPPFLNKNQEVPGCEFLEPEGGGDWTVSFPTILRPRPESLNEQVWAETAASHPQTRGSILSLWGALRGKGPATHPCPEGRHHSNRSEQNCHWTTEVALPGSRRFKFRRIHTPQKPSLLLQTYLGIGSH